ncbi:nuclear transcription factor Y subunit B-9-like [Vicia villosa]|uniref:nuclear transcription factor Y subunit B-9-like n=1 Tax=Vicia villosa TaxID=3911 RepID=UPI00273AF7EE|nr:nuclear transcription factor Y subunit B-9-like [Vicia villosa]
MEHEYPFIHNDQNSISSSGSSMLQQTSASTDAEKTSTTMNPTKLAVVPQLTRPEQNSLPLKNVTKIMRKGLPPHIKISDGAKEMAEQSASKFISMITKKATERCIRESRKILGAEDLLWAMMSLGYHNYFKSLSLYLERYRYSNGTRPMQLVCEIPKPILPPCEVFQQGLPPPPPPVALEANSSMNRNSSIEIAEEMNIDEFWDELSNLGDD